MQIGIIISKGEGNLDQVKFQAFCDCFYEAFQKMVFTIPGLELPGNYETAEIGGKIFSSIVGVVGMNKGRIHLEMSENLARKIYECVNGETVDEEMDLCFYLAEFTNMVTGNGVTALNNIYKGINLRLTPPAVFAGDNLEITTPQVMTVTKFFYTQYGAIRMEIGFEGV
jgi:CheY-specific phosphatase CheX